MPHVLPALDAQGLSVRVRIAGWMDFAQLGAFFAGCDVALMPMADTVANRSKCSVRYMDLMVAGVPIVASPVGEATTFVRDGETGYLARDASMEALLDAAAGALQDSKRGQMAEQARAYAMGELAWERLTAPLEGLYEGVLADRARFRG